MTTASLFAEVSRSTAGVPRQMCVLNDVVNPYTSLQYSFRVEFYITCCMYCMHYTYMVHMYIY